MQKVRFKCRASGVQILEVCAFLDEVQMIENTESKAAFYVRRGFNEGISGYGKETLFSAQVDVCDT